MMTPLEPLRILQLLAPFQFPSLKVKGGKAVIAYGNYRREVHKKTVEGKANTHFSDLTTSERISECRQGSYK